MKKILLIGASGMLGSTLGPFLRKFGYPVVTLGRNSDADFNADLTKLSETQSLIRQINPDVVINLIGLPNVDECESNLKKAYLINAQTVENISDVLQSQEQHSYLIHISTDHIYDGKGLHSEQDNITITNNYAMTKYLGELATSKLSPISLEMNKLMKDEKYLDTVICNGKDRAINVADPILVKIYEIIGFFRE